MDRISFDFENNTITIENDHQNGTEIDTELKNKRAAILEAAGLETIDLTETANIVNNFVNGVINEQEFITLMDEESERR